jgi:hypothetical protein
MTKIEELEQKLNECQKELAELKESKKEGKWKPKIDVKYYFVNSYGQTGSDYWENSEVDNYIYSHQPIFPNLKECERYKYFMDTVKEKSYEFSKEEWEDEDINKYFIRYYYGDKKWSANSSLRLRDLCKIYFKTEEDAQYIIDNFKDELMEFFV